MEDARPRDAKGNPLNDDEIRALVRVKLEDRSLPRQEPVIAGTGETLLGQALFRDPCGVCGGTTSQVRYYPDRPGQGLSFHERCWAIWREEIGKRQ